VVEINNICSDPKSSLNEVASIVKKDPISTATILKRVNSPLYGIMNNITTVEKAVAMLGKASTKAYILENAIKNNFEVNLDAYGMSELDFSLVAQKRTSLMIKWYSRVSFSKLSILATSSTISNIGQILISKEILDTSRKEEFFELLDDSTMYEAEKELVDMTTEEVTAIILEHWDFDPTLIDSIRYCNLDSEQVISDDVKPYVYANYAVHQAIDGFGDFCEDRFGELEDFLDKNDLDSGHFFDSLDIIRKFHAYE
jgi:HD-like signal output (HDOD) protein